MNKKGWLSFRPNWKHFCVPCTPVITSNDAHLQKFRGAWRKLQSLVTRFSRYSGFTIRNAIQRAGYLSFNEFTLPAPFSSCSPTGSGSSFFRPRNRRNRERENRPGKSPEPSKYSNDSGDSNVTALRTCWKNYLSSVKVKKKKIKIERGQGKRMGGFLHKRLINFKKETVLEARYRHSQRIRK